jgi:hypothetical protein
MAIYWIRNKSQKDKAMKRLFKKLGALVFILIFLSSCVSVRVASDYDTSTNFDSFKTFAFYKNGIDQAEINDIDKRRILRAIEQKLVARGFQKSSEPDVLINIFTKSSEVLNVWNNSPWIGGWGWGGFGWGAGWSSVSKSNESTLYIDLIDANKKELVWQGKGSGYLTQKASKKEERIKEFVSEILEEYPPAQGK